MPEDENQQFQRKLELLKAEDLATWQEHLREEDRWFKVLITQKLKDYNLTNQLNPSDITQTIVLKLWKILKLKDKNFSTEKDLRHYLVTIALNAIRTASRHQPVGVLEQEPEDKGSTASEHAMKLEQYAMDERIVEKLRNKLTEENNRIFVWRMYEKLSWREIVSRLERRGTVHTIQTRYNRNLQAVIEAMSVPER